VALQRWGRGLYSTVNHNEIERTADEVDRHSIDRMCSMTETRKIIAADREADGSLRVTVEVVTTVEVRLPAAEWQDARRKPMGKAAIRGAVTAALNKQGKQKEQKP
jgi:hypothetical protein